MNYTYQYLEDSTSHDDIGERPNHQAHLRSDRHFQINWQLNSQINWVRQQGRVSGDNRADLNDYANISLTLCHQATTYPLNVKFSLKNLLDNKFAERSQEPITLPVPAIPADLPMAGRNLYTKLQHDY